MNVIPCPYGDESEDGDGEMQGLNGQTYYDVFYLARTVTMHSLGRFATDSRLRHASITRVKLTPVLLLPD